MLAPWALPLLFLAASDPVQPVRVRYVEGLVNGFLVLRTTDGTLVADGALLQTSTTGETVTSRLVFHFKDGSIQDETVVFSQRGTFRVLSDHLIQKGPTFPRDLEAKVDVRKGSVDVRWRDKDGDKEESASERMRLPADLANGIVFTLLKNVPPGTQELAGHMLAFTPKPRVVKLAMTAEGEDSFVLSETKHRATRYRVKPELGGLTGLIAPLVGKEPPPVYVWITAGEVPAFVKFEGNMFLGGPTWRIELTSPRWPNADPPTSR
jgi:hypothetical protein